MDDEYLKVRNNPEEQRYEAGSEEDLAMLIYSQQGDRITFLHTEVPPDLEGHGVASRLAHTALEDARSQHMTVIPRCPFVAAYIRRHPEYLSLVPPHERARLQQG